MTKLLQKAFDEEGKLPEKGQDALGSLLLDEIEVERRREAQSSGMPRPEIRERYPHQWLLLEATEAHSSGGQRILESLTVLETCPDGLSAMRRYGEIHGQDPHRELYVLHTDRETVEIEGSPLGWNPGGLLKIRLEDGLPFVTVKLGRGTEELVLERVLLDTGSAATLFAVDEIATLGIVPEPADRVRRVVGIGGIELVLSKRIESLALGDIQVRDFPIQIGAPRSGWHLLGSFPILHPWPRPIRRAKGPRANTLASPSTPISSASWASSWSGESRPRSSSW